MAIKRKNGFAVLSEKRLVRTMPQAALIPSESRKRFSTSGRTTF
jgi:hypothetical protein